MNILAILFIWLFSLVRAENDSTFQTIKDVLYLYSEEEASSYTAIDVTYSK